MSQPQTQIQKGTLADREDEPFIRVPRKIGPTKLIGARIRALEGEGFWQTHTCQTHTCTDPENDDEIGLVCFEKTKIIKIFIEELTPLIGMIEDITNQWFLEELDILNIPSFKHPEGGDCYFKDDLLEYLANPL